MAKADDRVQRNVFGEVQTPTPPKKLKQAKLWFHTVDHEIKNPKNLESRKRKQSDLESISEIPSKIIKSVIVDKTNAENVMPKIRMGKSSHSSGIEENKKIVETNDNEVSSTSEADTLMSSKKLKERNLSNQEEISSTYEVIDLTFSDEEKAEVVSTTKSNVALIDSLTTDDLNVVKETEEKKGLTFSSEILEVQNVTLLNENKLVPEEQAKNGNDIESSKEHIKNVNDVESSKEQTKDVNDVVCSKEHTKDGNKIESSEEHTKNVNEIESFKEHTNDVESSKEHIKNVNDAESSKGRTNDVQSSKEHIKNVNDAESSKGHTNDVQSSKEHIKNVNDSESSKEHIKNVNDTESSKAHTKNVNEVECSKEHIKNVNNVECSKEHIKNVNKVESSKEHTNDVECSKEHTKNVNNVESSKDHSKNGISMDCSEEHTVTETKLTHTEELGKKENIQLSSAATSDQPRDSSVIAANVLTKQPDNNQSSELDMCLSISETKESNEEHIISLDDISVSKTEISQNSSKEDADMSVEKNSDSENEADLSDIEVMQTSFHNSSTSSSAKSDESFSETTFSSSLSDNKEKTKHITSTPTSKTKSSKMSESRKQERKTASEKRRKMRETERLEKMKKKEAEKLQKQQEKMKREKERLEKKAQLEQQKQEKLQEKMEEKKRKQELIIAKIEERKKREEEKRIKEEERKKEEEEKVKKRQKVEQAFSRFFIKPKMPSQKPKESVSSFFMPFEVKSGMVLAPVTRRTVTDEQLLYLDQCLQMQKADQLYLSEIKQSGYRFGKATKTVLPRPSDEMEIVEIDPGISRITYRAKFLSFHSNYRPPYYGTWRKKSKFLTPRNPFKKDDEMLDYEVDSDDEWEEDEPGESVENSEGEEEKDAEEDEEEDDDGWMVPHGHLSEDELCEEDEEVTPEVLKARQMAKAEAWEAELKRKHQPVVPIVIGCIWEADSVSGSNVQKLEQFKAVFLVSVIPISLVNENVVINKDSESGTPNRGALKRPVPEEAIPYLIRLLHGNSIGIKKIVEEFQLFWQLKNNPKLEDIPSKELESENVENKSIDESVMDDGDLKETGDTSISKRQLEKKIMAIATREKRLDKKICWFVHESVLQQYGCEDISLPNMWEYVSNVKKSLKSSDETQKNLASGLFEESMLEECAPVVEKSIPKDQRSIMDFAKKNVSIVVKDVEKSVSSASSSSSLSTTLVKCFPNDQRSIMDFTLKQQVNEKPSSMNTDSQQQVSVPASLEVPKEAQNKIPSISKLALGGMNVVVNVKKEVISATEDIKKVSDCISKPTISETKECEMEVENSTREDQDCIIIE